MQQRSSSGTRTLHLSVQGGPFEGVERRVVRRRLGAMMRALKLETEEVSVVLTDDVQMQQLNATYRGKDHPTDVLAFAQREGEFSSMSGDLLGDIVVSVPTALRQADERGAPLLDELTVLLAHGLLHLLGWDHETHSKDLAMRAETDRLVAAAASSSRGRSKA